MKYETKLLIQFKYFTPYSVTGRQRHLDVFKPYTLFGRNNITVTLEKFIRWYGWLTAEETSYTNASITSFNDSIDNSIMDYEGNACGIIAIPIIEINLDKWLYPCIAWYAKAIHVRILDLKVNPSRVNNTEHNMINHIFTPNLRSRKMKRKNYTIGISNYYLNPTNRLPTNIILK